MPDDDKRKHPRVPLLIEVLWEGGTGKYEARTTDISSGGCFIDTMGQVALGETIKFKLCLQGDEWIEVEGDVTYELPRAGFGVRFTKISEGDQKRLDARLATE
ncbi:MAG: PilZ domain-containing protein [Pyrinomonadaceae bacterium]